MDTQMALPPDVQPQENLPHNAAALRTGHGDRRGESDAQEEEHHDDKHSVLKKVKRKAKKIKETLKMHAHGSHANQEEGRVPPDDHDLYEEGADDEDEEILDQDPEFHGLSVSESAAMRRSVPPPVPGEEEKLRSGGLATQPGTAKGLPLEEEVVNKGNPGGFVDGASANREEGPGGPANSASTHILPPIQERKTELVEDPDAPKHKPQDCTPSNYQTKVADPSNAGGEAGTTPILQSLDKMKIHDEDAKQPFPTGSHDQFSPEPTRPAPVASDYPSNNSTTSAQGEDNLSKPTTPVEYGKKIAATVTETLAPVYEKVAGVGSSVVSRVHGSTTTSEGTEGEVKDKGVSMKEYFAEKLRPGEEDRALSEVISEVLHKQRAEAEEKATELEGAHLTSADVNDPAPGHGGSVVDKLKGVVGSWFGKQQGSPPAQHTASSASVGNSGSEFSRSDVGKPTGEGRLQESGN